MHRIHSYHIEYAMFEGGAHILTVTALASSFTFS